MFSGVTGAGPGDSAVSDFSFWHIRSVRLYFLFLSEEMKHCQLLEIVRIPRVFGLSEACFCVCVSIVWVLVRCFADCDAGADQL